jgi:hypothetical protein
MHVVGAERHAQPSLARPGAVPDSGTTIAGMKPICCSGASFGSGRNNRRHRSSNERETPYRRRDLARRP